MDLEINSIFDGKYKVLDVLGEGGMGKVYLVQNIKLGNYWAVKQVSKNQDERIDLLAEPNIMKKLNHPSLPRIFDIIENEEYIYIILDYVEGTSLDTLLEAGEKFPEQKVVAWAKEICNVYNYLHQQKPYPIIYRDMKPSNLMITSDGSIKVIDFGIAREYKAESKSDTTYLGTRGYAAPEQSDGTAQTDERSDIYSLGITLYHLVTGKGPNEPPYEPVPIRSLDSTLSEGLEQIIRKMTQRNPEQRYQHAAALLEDLRNIKKFSAVYKKERTKRRIYLSSLVASLALFAYLTSTGIQQYQGERVYAYDTLVRDASVDIEGSQFDDAKEKLAEAIDFMPETIDAYREYGRALVMERQYDEAIAYIEDEVFRTVPTSELDSDLYYLIGWSSLELEDYEKAIHNLEEAINLSHSQAGYYRELAISYARIGDFEKANEVLEEFIELDSSEAVNDYVIGEIQAAQGNYERAVEYFEMSLQNHDDEALKHRAFVSLAKLYKEYPQDLEDEHVEQRIAVLERAESELKANNDLIITEMLAEAYYNKAMYEGYDTELFSKSIERFETLLNQGYQRPYIYLNIAIIYQMMQEYEASERMLLEIIELYPDNLQGYTQLALLYAEMENKKPHHERNYDQTVYYYEKAVEKSPNGLEASEIRPLHHLILELRAKGWIH